MLSKIDEFAQIQQKSTSSTDAFLVEHIDKSWHHYDEELRRWKELLSVEVLRTRGVGIP